MSNADTEMVTRDATDELKKLAASRPLKWDLKDPLKKEPWLLAVETELQTDEEVWTAVTLGPPTPDKRVTMSAAADGDPVRGTAGPARRAPARDSGRPEGAMCESQD